MSSRTSSPKLVYRTGLQLHILISRKERIDQVEVLQPSQAFKVMSSWPADLTTLFLDAGYTSMRLTEYLCTFFSQKLTTTLLNQQKGENDCRNISGSIPTMDCCQTWRGSNPQILGVSGAFLQLEESSLRNLLKGTGFYWPIF